jgi:hypothetical protein
MEYESLLNKKVLAYFGKAQIISIEGELTNADEDELIFRDAYVTLFTGDGNNWGIGDMLNDNKNDKEKVSKVKFKESNLVGICLLD